MRNIILFFVFSLFWSNPSFSFSEYIPKSLTKQKTVNLRICNSVDLINGILDERLCYVGKNTSFTDQVTKFSRSEWKEKFLCYNSKTGSARYVNKSECFGFNKFILEKRLKYIKTDNSYVYFQPKYHIISMLLMSLLLLLGVAIGGMYILSYYYPAITIFLDSLSSTKKEDNGRKPKIQKKVKQKNYTFLKNFYLFFKKFNFKKISSDKKKFSINMINTKYFSFINFKYILNTILIIVLIPSVYFIGSKIFNFSFNDEYANINPNTLTKEERRAYTCVKTFGFKKGSNNFQTCIFKIYETEIQLQKLEAEKKLADAELKIAEANAKAAQARARADALERQAANARQEIIMKEQAANSRRQAAAAKAQARASQMQNALEMMQLGLQGLQPQRPSMGLGSSFSTRCTYGSNFINCF